MNYFAAEHGKGLCDGEACVVKSDVKKKFTTGTLRIPSLTDIVTSLTANLSCVSNESDRLHAIKERKFYGFARKFGFFLVHYIPFAISQV